MDHDGTREQLELAALEPGGLERLMAGDTATSQAVAAHLAGCQSCTDELVRLQRAAALIRDVIREMPSLELRARTLSAVRAEGVPRPIIVAPAAAVPGADAPAVGPRPGTGSPPTGPRRLWPVLGWVGTVAAAVVLSVATTSLIVGSRVDGQLAAQAGTIAALQTVTTATLDVSAEPDAEHVTLAGVSDPTLGGHLVYSPSTAQLVVVASGLTPRRPARNTAAGSRSAGRASASARCTSAATWPTGSARRRPSPAPRTARRSVSRWSMPRVPRSTRTRSSSASSDRGRSGFPGRTIVDGLAFDPVGRGRLEVGAVKLQESFGGLGGTSNPSSARTADNHAASRGRSTASTSASRRRESMMTSQTSPAPMTSPTMSSQTLNSAFTRRPV